MMAENELTLREMQSSQPWTLPYSNNFEDANSHGGLPHLYASHAVLHAMKTLGKIAAVFEAMDHRENPTITTYEMQVLKDMSADMVTMALRIANLYKFDLQSQLCRRVEEKNGVGFEKK